MLEKFSVVLLTSMHSFPNWCKCNYKHDHIAINCHFCFCWGFLFSFTHAFCCILQQFYSQLTDVVKFCKHYHLCYICKNIMDDVVIARWGREKNGRDFNTLMVYVLFYICNKHYYSCIMTFTFHFNAPKVCMHDICIGYVWLFYGVFIAISTHNSLHA